MKGMLIVVLSCIGIFAHGQYTVNGKIESQEDGQLIIGATIMLSNEQNATITDAEGKYEFKNISAGEYVLKASSVGFAAKELVVEVNANLEINLLLNERFFDLPDIVVESVTMTGGLAGARKVSGSAHFIGQKEIQKFSYTDINRTLRNVPGVNIQEEDGYGLRPNIGLRATGSERSSKITVMEDGILAAPAPYAAPAAYYFPTIGRMEAIEILKGSSQIKYGPYTTGGAINLISTPLPTKFGGHADFIAGSDNYKMLHANLGNAHKNVSYLVETMQYSADGFKQLDGAGNTGFNKEDFLGKFRINTNSDARVYQSLTFKVGQAQETSNETYLGLTDSDFEISPTRRYAGSQRDVMNTKQNQYSLTHYAQLTSFLDVQTSIYRTEFARNWYKLDKVNGQSISSILATPENYENELSILRGESDASNALAVKANNRSYYGKGIQSNIILHFDQHPLRHKVDIGLRVHQDQIDRFQWVDLYNIENGVMGLSQSGQPGTESNRVSVANAFSSYVQHKMSHGNLTLTSGLRYEHISIDRVDYGTEDPERTGQNQSERGNVIDIVIPGISASYQLAESSNLFAGIHKGFAPPGSKEGTNAEESWNYELGYRFSNKRLNGQVLAYLNDYSNLLGADLASSGGQGTQDLFNGGNAISQGVEVELSYDIVNSTSSTPLKIPMSLAYTYSKAYFTESFESEFDAWGSVTEGDLLPYVPKHQLSMTLSAEHKKFLFDLSTRYSAAMLTSAGTSELGSSEKTDNAFTVDLALNYRLSSTLSAFVNVNNISNNLYVVSRRPAGVRPNQPRTFNFGLKANF